MIRGIYIAATGMLTQRKKMNVLVNNIVNADTYGYKSDKLISRSFDEMLLERLDAADAASDSSQIGGLGYGIHADEVYTTFQQGSLDQTGLSTDLAITGDGFFEVQTPDGLRYTRNGNFTVADGYLVTAEGYRVMGKSGPIQIEEGEFIVAEDGTITAGDQEVGQLRIVKFEDMDALSKQGNCYFVNSGANPQEDDASVVNQGYLETSDVNLADTMVEIIKVSRLYEANQRIVTAIDETLQKAVTEIGSV